MPTDNLYKFAAISGMWLALGLLLFFAWLIHTDIQLDRESKAFPAYANAKNTLRNIEQRLEAIDNGMPEQNKLSWVSQDLSAGKERSLLQKIAKRHRKTIADFQALNVSSDISETMDVFQRTDVRCLGVIYIFFTVSMLIFGFTGWKRKVHDVDMELRAIDLTARKKELEKLELELAEKRGVSNE
ncbi:hypothetical protein [Salinisphaera japonica]|nr:hypothetical protein [Salinisphaera japonica]